MNEEELKQALEAAQQEVEKLKSIKTDVVAQRDEIKKKYETVETKLTAYEETMNKTNAELEAERNKRTEIAAIYTATIKTTAVKAALAEEGVIAMDTALKLIPLDEIVVDDAFSINTDTVKSVVSKLKQTDTVLFKTSTTPPVDADGVPKPKRASEGEPKAGFSVELKSCKTAADVEALLRKAGKIA